LIEGTPEVKTDRAFRARENEDMTVDEDAIRDLLRELLTSRLGWRAVAAKNNRQTFFAGANHDDFKGRCRSFVCILSFSAF